MISRPSGVRPSDSIAFSISRKRPSGLARTITRNRTFKRQFNLADHVEVRGAAFDNGLLKIELVREIPEAMKPRRIAINGVSVDNVKKLEAKAA
jgi:HSP20 family molecular chaperone IbpA